MQKLIRFFLVIGCILTCVLIFPGTSRAHQAGLSRGEYRLDGAMFTAEIIVARADAALLARGLDADGNGTITPDEVRAARPALGKSLTPKLVVRSGREECLGNVDDVFLVEEDGLSIRLNYLCPTPPASVHMRFDVLDVLAFGHRHIARAESGTTMAEEVFFGTHREWDLEPAATTAPRAQSAPSQSLGAFFLLGIEHILLGYDHLVFLLGLVLVGGRWRSILLVITAFTLAHSITLGMAVLGVWAPSPRIV
ncbi:MAG TPA: HupE/UreJ family protein, partial [Polyangium sp.]|nr:HupE/UreJ family protein [Polyangium sp.]